MGKCLVVKLQEVVNADLPKFGIMSVSMPSTIINFHKFVADETGKWPSVYAKCVSGAKFTYNEEDLNEIAGVYNSGLAVVKTGDVPGVIEWDYYKSQVICGAFDVSKVVSGNILGINPVKYADQQGTPGYDTAYGDIANIATNVPNLLAFKMNYVNLVTGKITDFAGCLSIKNINLNNSWLIKGDVKELADRQILLGRDSGTLIITAGHNITNDGTAVENGTVLNITYSQGSYVIN